MKACGAGAGSSEPESSLGAGEKLGLHPQALGSISKEWASGSHADTQPSQKPKPTASPPGPAAPGIWTLQIPGGWAVHTDANSQRVSGCSGRWGPEDTGVRGSAQERGPSAAHILPGAVLERSRANVRHPGDRCPALHPRQSTRQSCLGFPLHSQPRSGPA